MTKASVSFTNADGERLDVTNVEGGFSLRSSGYFFKSPAALCELLSSALKTHNVAFGTQVVEPAAVVEPIPAGYEPLAHYAERAVKLESLYNAINDGKLKSKKINGKHFVCEEDYAAYRKAAEEGKERAKAMNAARMKAVWAKVKEG